jgi:hypothetical protein
MHYRKNRSNDHSIGNDARSRCVANNLADSSEISNALEQRCGIASKVSKKCHWCKKELRRTLEQIFTHCFECNLKRLDEMTPSFEPCTTCREVKK